MGTVGYHFYGDGYDFSGIDYEKYNVGIGLYRVEIHFDTAGQNLQQGGWHLSAIKYRNNGEMIELEWAMFLSGANRGG